MQISHQTIAIQKQNQQYELMRDQYEQPDSSIESLMSKYRQAVAREKKYANRCKIIISSISFIIGVLTGALIEYLIEQQ